MAEQDDVVGTSVTPAPEDTPPGAAVRLRPLSRAERAVVGSLSSAQGALFVWAAWVLPWTSRAPFSAAALLAGASHAACAVACVALPRWAAITWRFSAFCSLGLLALSTWMVATSSAYLVRTYSSLGAGLAAAFLAVLGLVALLTLPTSCWALVRTRGCPPNPIRTIRRALGLGVAGVLALGVGSARTVVAASTSVVADRLTADEIDGLRKVLEVRSEEAHPRPLDASAIAKCKSSPRSTPTAVLHYRSRNSKKTRAKCVQARDRGELLGSLSKQLGKSKTAWDVKLDWVTGTALLDSAPTVLAAVALRPGLDGVCWERHCFMPWQLLARGEFLRHRPLPFLRDLRFGASSGRLARALGGRASDATDLVRVETQSVVLGRGGGWEELRRMRPVHVDVDRSSVSGAITAAGGYVLRAQGDDGVFAYTIDPFSGAPTSQERFNLARQAGTTLALCDASELAASSRREELRGSVERSLDLLRANARRADDATIAALSLDGKSSVVRLGGNALPLVAFLRCRNLVGTRYDDTIARLTRFVLAAQLPNGNFPPYYRLRTDRHGASGPIEGTQPLYAGGQAILALLLLEKTQLRAGDEGGLPRVEGAPGDAEIRSAIDRAMTYVTDEHWVHPLRAFFFIEENWHCIAARAALGFHESPAYERYCYDYMAFKSRLILDESSDVDSEFVGGFGFGNVIPPHNTGAAGLAEALAATIAVKQAHGIDATSDRNLLVDSMRFLMRQQWTERNGFACAPNALGSMSEHTHSPEVRIDFVQHLLSGLLHGGAVTGILEAETLALNEAEPSAP